MEASCFGAIPALFDFEGFLLAYQYQLNVFTSWPQ
jgi:hypothetical protein